jgi:hypothetical protein
LLRNCTLVVIAYSGWDDVFTETLADLLNDAQAEVNVWWCFYEDDATEIARRYEGLFQKVTPIIGRRFSAYGGINCHEIFSEIVAELRGGAAAATPAVPPPYGWEIIDAPRLSAEKPLHKDEVLLYFDGASPTWRHAVSDAIPRREKVGEILTGLQTARGAGRCSVNVILAAGGEGKSTVLLQTAADLAREGGWSVLWRSREDAGIAPAEIEKLDPGKCWLLVSDDGDKVVEGVRRCVERLHETGRTNVHFLLAAREPEWQHASGYRLTATRFQLWGLSHKDATDIVRAWGRYGEQGLKALYSVPNPEARVRVFERAVNSEFEEQDEGSFFGGLLDARLGERGLRNHVITFLERLRMIEVEGSTRNLFDALIYVAACHGVGIPGLHDAILADLIGVPRAEVYTRVVRPLGEEAVGTRSSRYVFTRHRKVAEAILVEAEASFKVDLAEKWAHIVRQAHRTGEGIDGVIFNDKSYPKILHAGPLLMKDLPKEIPVTRREVIAMAAAKESILCDSNRLSRLVDLGKTYLEASRLNEASKAHWLDEASNLFRSNLAGLRAKEDYKSVIRGYWFEWAVCEGNKKNYVSDAWLTAISISDHLGVASLSTKDVILGITGLGVAFGHLARVNSAETFARGLRACASIGMELAGSDRDEEIFSGYRSEANVFKVPDVENVEQALDWLRASIAASYDLLADEFIKRLVAPAQLTFGKLSDLLRPPPEVEVPERRRVIKLKRRGDT